MSSAKTCVLCAEVGHDSNVCPNVGASLRDAGRLPEPLALHKDPTLLIHVDDWRCERVVEVWPDGRVRIGNGATREYLTWALQEAVRQLVQLRSAQRDASDKETLTALSAIGGWSGVHSAPAPTECPSCGSDERAIRYGTDKHPTHPLDNPPLCTDEWHAAPAPTGEREALPSEDEYALAAIQIRDEESLGDGKTWARDAAEMVLKTFVANRWARVGSPTPAQRAYEDRYDIMVNDIQGPRRNHDAP